MNTLKSYSDLIKLETESEEEQEFTREFLRLFEALPALWNTNSKEYDDKKLKAKSYDVLIAKYNEIYPGTTQEDVTKRLNSLRSNFRKEKQRIQEVFESSKVTRKILTHLYYWNEIQFLDDFEELEVSSSHSEKKENGATNPKGHEQILPPPQDAIPSKRRCLRKPSWQSSKAPASSLNAPVESLDASSKSLEAPGSLASDEFTHQAQVWAMEIAKMSPEQRIHAKKAINDILYEGQLGNLRPHCVRIELPSLTDYRPSWESWEAYQEAESEKEIERVDDIEIKEEHEYD